MAKVLVTREGFYANVDNVLKQLEPKQEYDIDEKEAKLGVKVGKLEFVVNDEKPEPKKRASKS